MSHEDQPSPATPNQPDPTVERELDLLQHREAPRTHLQQQIVLAEELYHRDHPEDSVDLTDVSHRNKIMEYWGSSGYSDLFRRVRLHPNFLTKPEFQGDFTRVTLEVLTRYSVDPHTLEGDLG